MPKPKLPKKDKKPVIPKLYRDCAGVELTPSAEHPVCAKCAMHCGKSNPFIAFSGSDDPLLTVVFEGPSKKEDETGVLASDGWNAYVRKAINAVAERSGFPVDRVRYAAVTLCAPGKKDVIKTKGNFCRWFLMQDLIEHPPRCILPVGTAAAGLLHHKGNTQDWQGRVLQWRGWPDDWISDQRFVDGHPIFGRPPVKEEHGWLVSVKHPRIVAAEGTESARRAWLEAIVTALEVAEHPPEVPSFDRPWFDLTSDVDRIRTKLTWLVEHPNTLVSFDTETTGLQPWANDAKIVLMMLRWDDDNGPQSVAFPWEHEDSPLMQHDGSPLVEGQPARTHVDALTPLLLEALYASTLQGQNLTFDIQFVIARLGADIVRISDAMRRDTWHMNFTLRQIRESMGLETMPYRWCPEWSGYEEEMTLLIDRLPAMQPDKGGHYANCPPELWDSHLKPYIMGDVEVVRQVAPRIEMALNETSGFRIPLASVHTRGKFRHYATPDRKFVYDRIMAPANRLLTKLMGRGMFVDRAELDLQESETPKRIRETKEEVRNADPRIIQWVDSKTATVEDWEFDLDKPAVLKELLFDVLSLPVKRLTKNGRKEYGEDAKGWAQIPRSELMKYAAADKFTLNSMAAEHPELRPLLDYRKVSKIYTTYVRPMRNLFTVGIDKKHRSKPQILMPDGCVHTSFMLCGTRGGRLCVSGDTVLDVRVGKSGRRLQIEIKDIWKLSQEAECIYIRTHRNRWRKINALFFKGYEKMYQIHTKNGSKIEATGGHRLHGASGWVSVRDLEVGSVLWVDQATRRWHDSEQRELRAVCDSPATWIQGAGSGSRQEHCGAELEILQACVRGGAANVKRSSLCGSHRREYARQTEPTVSATSEGGVSVSGGGWLRPLATGGSFQNICVLSREEYALLRQGAWTEAGIKSDTAAEARSYGEVGESRARLEHYACRYLRSATGIPFESVRRLRIDPDGCVVFEGHVPKFVPVYAGKNNSTCGRGVMVRQAARVGACEGTTQLEDSILEGMHVRPAADAVRVPFSMEGGFRIDRDEHFCRDRRGLSCEGRGLETRRLIGGEGLSCGAVHRGGGVTQDGLRDLEDTGRDVVTSIESTDIKAVWDIEVEEDHSYVAGGLIHHNSSRSPNLQNIAKDGVVKALYTSRFGRDGAIYHSDLSQIELRLLAAACGDAAMVDAYERKLDLHSLTCSKIYKIPYEHFQEDYQLWLQSHGKDDVIKKMSLNRKVAKTVNFLTGYGGGALGLQNVLAAQQIYLSLEECEDIIESFFSNYPSLRDHIAYYKHFVLENALAVSLTGRVRLFPEVYSTDRQIQSKALRSGYNHLIQTTASDIMLACLMVIEMFMREAGLESMLVSTVHDSLVIDAKRNELDTIHGICGDVFENIPEVMQIAYGDDYDTSWMFVPLAGDRAVGTSYLQELKIKPDANGQVDWDRLLSGVARAA